MAHLLHLSRRATYTVPAIQRYFKHISLPASHQSTLLRNLPRHDPVAGINPSEWGTSRDGMRALEMLQKYHQAKMPFANLYLHYSPYHLGALEPEALFRYLVNSEAMVSSSSLFARSQSSDPLERGEGGILNQEMKPLAEAGRTERERRWTGRKASGGRGGSCTLNNGFFGTVMRSLGMQVKTTGARVALSYNGGPEGVYGGWNHLVNLVSSEGRTFLVDVGFSGNAPTAPMELKDGLEMPWGATSDRVRLIYAPIPEFTDLTSRAWILQHKRPKGDWKDIYVFTTAEFLPQDIKVMNYSTTFNIRGFFFNHMIICSRRIMEGGEIVGTLSLVDGKVKKRVGEKSELVQECQSEIERWEALEKWFGIVLGEEERFGIKGLVTELKGELEVDEHLNAG